MSRVLNLHPFSIWNREAPFYQEEQPAERSAVFLGSGGPALHLGSSDQPQGSELEGRSRTRRRREGVPQRHARCGGAEVRAPQAAGRGAGPTGSNLALVASLARIAHTPIAL